MPINAFLNWPGVFFLFKLALGSSGDKSLFYIYCVKNCNSKICEPGTSTERNCLATFLK